MEAPYTGSNAMTGAMRTTSGQADASEMYCDVQAIYELSGRISQHFTRFVNDASNMAILPDFYMTEPDPIEENRGSGQMLAYLNRAYDQVEGDDTLEGDYKLATTIKRIFDTAKKKQAKVMAIGRFLAWLADSYDVNDARLLMKLDETSGISKESRLWALNNMAPVGTTTELGGLLGMIVGDKAFDHPFLGGSDHGAFGFKGTLASVNETTTWRRPSGEKVTGSTTWSFGSLTATFTPNSTHYYKDEGKVSGGEGFSFGIDLVGLSSEVTERSTGEKRKFSVGGSAPIDKLGKAGKITSYLTNTMQSTYSYDDKTQSKEEEVCLSVFVVPVGGCHGHSDGYNMDDWKTVSERYQSRPRGMQQGQTLIHAAH